MEPTYEFWQYTGTGEIYAVRIEHATLTGICGPLHPDEVRSGNLAAFDYDDQRDDVAWAQEHEPEAWRVIEPAAQPTPPPTA